MKEGSFQIEEKNYLWISQIKPIIEFPYGLKEGNVVFYAFSAQQMAFYLEYKGYSKVVELSGYFKNAQKQEIKSKMSVKFDIERYKKVKGINNRPPIQFNGKSYGEFVESVLK